MTTTKPKKTTRKATAIPDLPVNPFLFEVLDVIVAQKTKARKIEALRKFGDNALKTIFIWNFDETVESTLPPGDVPYAAVDEQDSFSGTLSEKIRDAVDKMEEIGSKSLGSQDQGKSSIRKEYRRFYNFVKGGNDALSSLRKETMFINILQGLHPLEAEIVVLTKDKRLETKYKVSKAIVSEAFPDIRWGNRG